MAKVERCVQVPYSAQQMYDLVNDVLSYPQFLPGCAKSRVLSRTDVTQQAEIDVEMMGISKTFSTTNKMVPGQKIELALLKGPFKSLDGSWVFTPESDKSCRIRFDLSFEFNNPIVELAFGKIFAQLMESMVQAFVDRAKVVYG